MERGKFRKTDEQTILETNIQTEIQMGQEDGNTEIILGNVGTNRT